MKNFVIVGMPRTGSTLLLTGLMQHPEITAFSELFHQEDAQRYRVHAIKREDAHIAFNKYSDDAIRFLQQHVYGHQQPGTKAVGFKLFHEYVVCQGTENLLGRIVSEIPEISILHIYRENYLDVLISRRLAEKTKKWMKTDPDEERHKPIKLKIAASEAYEYFEKLSMADAYFSSISGRVEYKKINYNDLSADYSSTMAEVYEFLGVSPFKATSRIFKQNHQSPESIIYNYAKFKQYFASSRYANFF